MKFAADPDSVAEELAKHRERSIALGPVVVCIDPAVGEDKAVLVSGQLVDGVVQIRDLTPAEQGLAWDVPTPPAACREAELQRRIGKFRIARYMRKDYPTTTLMTLFSQCFVLEARWLWDFDGTEYTAISPQFMIVAQGCEAVHYEVRGDSLGHAWFELNGKPLT